MIIGSTYFVSEAELSLNKWTHVAVTWSRYGGEYRVCFYEDGSRTDYNITKIEEWGLNTGPVRIGGYEWGKFLGKIDEVRFWSDARTREEIRASRFTGIVIAPPSDAHLSTPPDILGQP